MSADGARERLVLPVPPAPLATPVLSSSSADMFAATMPAPQSFVLAAGGTLMDVVLDAGADRTDAFYAIEALKEVTDVRRLRPGVKGQIAVLAGSLQSLSLRLEAGREVLSRREADGFVASAQQLSGTDIVAYSQGSISRSLYLDARDADVPAQIIVEMIRLLSYDVDLQRDVREGDRFSVMYDRRLIARDGVVSNGSIQSIRFETRGRLLSLTRFIDPASGQADYFHADGRSVRRSLLKTPIDGARLTSRFGRRKHPVLGYTRMHKGLDFGAATGTPVYAAGDGVVERASTYGSYGRYVRLRHGGSYKTAYAHLSRYGAGIKAGTRVRQGDIIGYVGASGRVTGPHLHYEVIADGQHVNPQSLKLPPNKRLAGQALEAFDRHSMQTELQRATLSGIIEARSAHSREAG